MPLTDYSIDAFYQLAFNPVINKIRRRKNWVGPQLWQILTPAPAGTYADADTIFVHADTGNDSTGNGTSGNPYLTMAKGASMCVVAKQRVVVTCTASSKYIKDDYPYPVTNNVYFQACYSASGKMIYWTDRTLGYTPSDANTIYVAKSGNDANAGTLAAPVLTLTGATGAISKVTAGKQSVIILDSYTYNETAFTFTGNFKNLYADYGVTPTITIIQNVSSTTYSPVTVATTSVDATGTCTYPMIAKFADDSFVNVWVTGGIIYFALYRNNDYCYKSKTAITGAGTMYVDAVFVLPSSQYFVVIFRSTTAECWVIYDKNGTLIHSAVSICSTSVTGHGAAFSDDTWVACWCDSASSYGYYFATFNATGTAVVPATYIDYSPSGSCYSINVAVQSNNNMIFSYAVYLTYNYLYNKIYSQSGLFIKTITTTITHNPGTWMVGRNSTVILSDDSIMIFYSHNADWGYLLLDNNYNIIKINMAFTLGDVGYGTYIFDLTVCKASNDNIIFIKAFEVTNSTVLGVLDKNGNIIFKEIQVLAIHYGYYSSFINSQGDVILSRLDASPYFGYTRINNFYFIGANIAVASIINGITFDCQNQTYLKYFFTGSSNLTRKWCEFKNQVSTFFEAYSNLTQAGLSLLTGALDRRYDYIHDCYHGDNVTNAVAKFYNNIFLNCKGIDAQASGTAASDDDITYRHNSVQSAGGGFYLTGNGGVHETIKDNAFNNVAGYNISVAVALTVYNSILTGSYSNITLSGCITLNPLFLDEGFLGSSLANLDLKSIDMWDFASSPGLLAASDGKNIGAYDTLLIGPPTSWTTFQVTKPKGGIKPGIKYAGPVNIQKQTGDWGSSREGISEVIPIDHSDSALLLSEVANFFALITCGKNQVMFWGNPITYPAVYGEFIFLYDDFDAYDSNYKLTKTGIEKIQYRLARKFT